jgi:hypothetical protein
VVAFGLNRTLDESPRHRFASLGNTKKKKCSLHFSFWCSALQVFGQCGGAKCGLGFAKTIFWGEEFGKTSAD